MVEADKPATAEVTKNKAPAKTELQVKKVRSQKHKLKKFHEDSIISLFATKGP